MPTTDSLSATQTPKKLALVNDLAGYGRCSLTVALPIVSQLGVQGCPVPTAILSNHTGYPTWHMTDYTSELSSYLDAWKSLDISFDGILTGFLGNQAQADIIRQFLADFKKENTLYILDPAMGDNGRVYATCGTQIQKSMRELVASADAITPNVTEACLLTGTAYRPDFTQKELLQMAQKLLKMGPKQVVITGISCKSYIGNLCMTAGESTLLRTKKVPQSRHGTGDIFSAILAAELVKVASADEELSIERLSLRHEILTAAVKKASGFVRKCLLVSDAAAVPEPEGVCFEKILYQLK
ncbi:MAG: pyridoxamine kinase [Lachnospiraceae bacterium]|nr:pyridoxamine kinase [Lachnospiraceae bacterium]